VRRRGRYKVVGCPKCFNYFITKATRHFKCIYCGYRDRLDRVRIWYSSDDIDKARRYLQALQLKKRK